MASSELLLIDLGGCGRTLGGQLLQLVAFNQLGVIQLDESHPIFLKAFVDLVEVLLDDPLLLVGGLAAVRFACVLDTAVVDAAATSSPGGGRAASPWNRFCSDE